MKKIINKIKNFFIDVLAILIIVLPPIIVIAIVMWISYLVSISDLPDWFKFFLLK